MKQLFIILLLTSFSLGWGQSSSRVRIGFWNVQNLFDTINSPAISDGLYTPQSKKKWNSYKYNEKIEMLSHIASGLNVDILALCEVENREVVEDLSSHMTASNGKAAKIVHYNSCDPRGIDQAIIYNPTKMNVIESGLIATATAKPKRELLYALFSIKNGIKYDTIAFYIVHLPSKLGGEVAAVNRRRIVAQLDSISWTRRYESVVMGDMNDDPIDVSGMINCAQYLQKQGLGSYTYRGFASMLDQILVTEKLNVNQLQLCDNYGVSAAGRRKKASDHKPIKIDLLF